MQYEQSYNDGFSICARARRIDQAAGPFFSNCRAPALALLRPMLIAQGEIPDDVLRVPTFEVVVLQHFNPSPVQCPASSLVACKVAAQDVHARM